MDTDRLEASPDEAATAGDGDMDMEGVQDDQPSRMREMFRTALDRVAEQTSERPLVALAAAGAVGYVVGGGLPRWRAMIGLLGVGGLVGYGITAMRRRMTADDGADEGADEGATQDEGHDADVIANAADDEAFATPPAPSAGQHRRKKKKKHDAPTAG